MLLKREFIRHALFAAFVVLAVQASVFSAAQEGGGPVLSGTITGWDRGEARLAAESFVAVDDAPLGAIAEATIAEDGSFELALPAEVPTELLTPLDATEICLEAPEGLSLSPERFMGAGVFALSVYEGEVPVGFIAQASSEAVVLEEEGSAQVGDYAVFYVYAAEPVAVRGRCVREADTEDVNLDLQAGWNTLVSSATGVTDGVMSAAETTVGEAPEGAAWYFVAFPEGEEESSKASQDAPEGTYTAQGETFQGPEELPAGFVTFSYRNEGEGGYTFLLLRLKEGATAEEVVAAVEAVDRAFAEGGDAPAALNEALELADVIGEAFVEPGATSGFGVTLEAGSYIMYGSSEAEEEGAPPVSTHIALEVTAGESEAQAPQTDVTVRMVDFAFALPPDIRAGTQTWEVVNVGEQLHHLVLFKLNEGKTMDDFMAWMETEGEGEPVAEEAGGVGVLSSGQSNYVNFELTPGEYVAICFMPDHVGGASGQPHFMLGMMQAFTVDGE